LLVRRSAFDAAGGFSEDYRVLAHEAELVARAQLMGLNCDMVLQDLGEAGELSTDWLAMRGYDLPASRFRVIRPMLAASPLSARELLLLAKGLQPRGGGAGRPTTKSKAPRLDAIIEEPFVRLMQEILTEGRAAIGRSRASSVVVDD
jgi:hypothetical protein